MEQIMETGVDEMSWDDLSKNEMEWPKLREVTEYRRAVYNLVKDVILNGDYPMPITMDSPGWALVMGFEHERIHLETSSVLMRELPAYLVTRPKHFPLLHPSAVDADRGYDPQPSWTHPNRVQHTSNRVGHTHGGVHHASGGIQLSLSLSLSLSLYIYIYIYEYVYIYIYIYVHIAYPLLSVTARADQTA